jgi:hypothetical protein
MRDKRFIPEHRGGLLKKEQQVQMAKWALACIQHIVHLYRGIPDVRFTDALAIAEKWVNGEVMAGEARKAAFKGIELAREITDPVNKAIIRAAHHTVATAHMADHSLGGAIYSLMAVKHEGGSVQDERTWQNEQLPAEIKDIILESRAIKEKVFKLTPKPAKGGFG